MPLIKPEGKSETKEAWRIRLRESVGNEILAYCEWAGIQYRDTFIERACLHIFSEDKKWQAHRANTGASKQRQNKSKKETGLSDTEGE